MKNNKTKKTVTFHRQFSEEIADRAVVKGGSSPSYKADGLIFALRCDEKCSSLR